MFFTMAVAETSAIKSASVKFSRAIKRRREEIGITQEELALRAVVSPSLITKIERGAHPVSKMSLENLFKIIAALGWSIDGFEKETSIEIPFSSPEVEFSGFTLAPILGIASAGRPFDYPVPIEVYRRGMAVYQVQGNSMNTGTPDSLQDGDYLLIDRNITSFQDGKVYVVEVIGDGMTVKRARKLNGTWYLMADNPAHESFKVNEIRVVGQVYQALGKRSL
jgi:repressor LexA